MNINTYGINNQQPVTLLFTCLQKIKKKKNSQKLKVLPPTPGQHLPSHTIIYKHTNSYTIIVHHKSRYCNTNLRISVLWWQSLSSWFLCIPPTLFYLTLSLAPVCHYKITLNIKMSVCNVCVGVC